MPRTSRSREALRGSETPGDVQGAAPLRVALVVERFDRDGGGLERVAWEVARGLVALGDDVHVISRKARAMPGVSLRTVSVPARFQPFRLLEFSRAARRVVETDRFDVVHAFARVHAQDLLHGGLGCHAAYMQAVHGPVGAALRRFLPRHAVLLRLERALAGDPRVQIQAVSQSVRDEFARAYEIPDDRFVMLPNGVDLERIDAALAAAGRDVLRHELAPGAEAVWLLPGSGFRRKGVSTAIEALAASRLRRAHLWVAGRDDPAPWMRCARRAGVADRVHFLGLRDDIERLYAACDGVLLPTRYDAGGLVVLEAAAAGRPVVTSAVCGHVELLGDAARVVARADDVQGFAQALDGLADGGVRQRLGRLARARVEIWSWPNVVARLREHYLQIAATKRQSL